MSEFTQCRGCASPACIVSEACQFPRPHPTQGGEPEAMSDELKLRWERDLAWLERQKYPVHCGEENAEIRMRHAHNERVDRLLEALVTPQLREVEGHDPLAQFTDDPEPAVAVGVEKGDIQWLERAKDVGHCGEGTAERRPRDEHNARIDRILAALTAPATSLGPPRRHAEIVDFIWQGLLDKDDRTSPEEYPDMVLISKDELSGHIAECMGEAAWQASQAVAAPSLGLEREAVEQAETL